MKIECTVEEFRELLKDTAEKEARERLKKLLKEETPVAGTTDVIKIKTAHLNNQPEFDIAVLKEKFKENLENLLKNQ